MCYRNKYALLRRLTLTPIDKPHFDLYFGIFHFFYFADPPTPENQLGDSSST